MTSNYSKPKVTEHGSIASLTLGKPGSDVDGNSGMQGNASDSDSMPDAGINDGVGP